MAEWLKAHDSKSCGPKGLGGSNPLASAINVGIEKDSMESFYLFKLKLKNEDSLSSASSSQKCKHFCELLLEGESNFFERGETQGFCEAKFDFLASAKFTKNRTLLVPT